MFGEDLVWKEHDQFGAYAVGGKEGEDLCPLLIWMAQTEICDRDGFELGRSEGKACLPEYIGCFLAKALFHFSCNHATLLHYIVFSILDYSKVKVKIIQLTKSMYTIFNYLLTT
jgi:hypothetical protein